MGAGRGCAGGDKGKSQQKVLVFASGIRKVFGHPFNWGDREGAGGPQAGAAKLVSAPSSLHPGHLPTIQALPLPQLRPPGHWSTWHRPLQVGRAAPSKGAWGWGRGLQGTQLVPPQQPGPAFSGAGLKPPSPAGPARGGSWGWALSSQYGKGGRKGHRLGKLGASGQKPLPEPGAGWGWSVT